MKPNLIISVGFIVLAAVLIYLSFTNKLGNGWLDKVDKVASVVSLVIAIVAFINPFSDDGKASDQQVTVGNNNRQVNIGQAQDGSSVTIGDTSTSADQRSDTAAEQINAEVLRNFSQLAILIQMVEGLPPEEFWDKRRANETELAYQDRAANHFRDYIQDIDDQIKLLKFSTSSYAAYRRDLSHTPKVAQRTEQVYDAHDEVVDSFARLHSGLQHLLGLNLSDVERTAQSSSLHQEKLANAKMMLSQAAAHFSLVAESDEMNLLADSFSLIGIDSQWASGRDGYRTGMELASRFTTEKVAIFEARLNPENSATRREIDRRINDPYLIRLRELAGLSTELTRNELQRLQNTELNTTEQDPLKLFQLANFSYLEMDGAAAVIYFQRALDTGELSSKQAQYARASIHRIQNPDYYEDSLGVMIVNIEADSSFAQVGLAVGDVIVSADGQVVNEPLEIATALAQSSNDRLVLKVIRGDQKLAIAVPTRQSAGAALTQLILLNAVQV